MHVYLTEMSFPTLSPPAILLQCPLPLKILIIPFSVLWIHRVMLITQWGTLSHCISSVLDCNFFEIGKYVFFTSLSPVLTSNLTNKSGECVKGDLFNKKWSLI